MASGLVEVEQPTVALLLEAGKLLAQMGRHKPASDVFDGVEHLRCSASTDAARQPSFRQGKLALAEKPSAKRWRVSRTGLPVGRISAKPCSGAVRSTRGSKLVAAISMRAPTIRQVCVEPHRSPRVGLL